MGFGIGVNNGFGVNSGIVGGISNDNGEGLTC